MHGRGFALRAVLGRRLLHFGDRNRRGAVQRTRRDGYARTARLAVGRADHHLTTVLVDGTFGLLLRRDHRDRVVLVDGVFLDFGLYGDLTVAGLTLTRLPRDVRAVRVHA